MLFKVELWANKEAGFIREVTVPDNEAHSEYSLKSPYNLLEIIKKFASKPANYRGIAIGDVIQLANDRYMVDRDGIFMMLDGVKSYYAKDHSQREEVLI